MKNDMIVVRVPPNMRFQLDTMAVDTGYSISSITKAAIIRLLSEVYDTEGYIINPDVVGKLGIKKSASNGKKNKHNKKG